MKIRFGLKQFQPPGNPETVAVPPLNGMAWMLELNAGDLVDGSIFASPALGAFYIVGPEQETVLYATHTMSIAPEENSNPRVVHISKTLIQMLNRLPRTYGDRIFSHPHMPVDHLARQFCLQRKRLANKTGNQRLLKIHFHTPRHWKGTMLYHKTKDIYHTMQALGHKNIKNTLLYIQLEEALFQGEKDYISKVAKTEKDICALIEQGFEYVTEFEGARIFRKPKT